MLTNKGMQTYLKRHGFYTGEVDGLIGPKTKEAVLALQKKYLPKKYHTGIYDASTNIVLVNLDRVARHAPHFTLEEFKCSEYKKNKSSYYCNGYPKLLDEQLLINLEKTRVHFNKPIIVSCGERCQTYNDSIRGSIKTSKHTKGKAVDFYVTGLCDTVAGREKVRKYWMSLEGSTYSYYYDPKKNSFSNMGNVVHGDVK